MSEPAKPADPITTREVIVDAIAKIGALIIAIPVGLLVFVYITRSIVVRSIEPPRAERAIPLRAHDPPYQSPEPESPYNSSLIDANAAEALTFLRRCVQPAPSDRGVCQLHQSSFVEFFVKAKAGYGFYPVMVANVLGKRTAYQDRYFYGVPYNPTEECAWRIVAAKTSASATPENRDLVDTTCRRLTPAKRRTAETRARSIKESTDPEAMPPSGWRYVIRDD